MSQRPFILGEKMGTTWYLLPFKTLAMTQLNNIRMPDQSSLVSTTTALFIEGHQDGSVKCSTNDQKYKL